MKILITGAGGFLGQWLAKELLKDPSHKLVLNDIFDCPVPKGAQNTQNVQCVKADLSQDRSVITKDLDVAYIFHGIMSSGSEANYDLGMKVNVDSTRLVLDDIRRVRPGLRVIYASSLAVYGRPLPDVLDETTLPTPEGSYGAEKFMTEILINDMTRRGMIDGFILRFPTITVRPGAPSAAASSFISGIVREPVDGKECIVPIKDRKFPSWVATPKSLIHNLVHTLTLPSDALPSHNRRINMPGNIATVQEMMDALAKVCGQDILKLVKEEHDEPVAKILYSWAFNYSNKFAFSLGYQASPDFETSVREYLEWLDDQKKLNGQ